MPSQHPPTRPRIGRLIAAQFAVGALATGSAGVLAGSAAALAAGLGALSCALPQSWFAWRALGPRSRGDVHTMLRALYRGEAVKLAAIAVFLIGIFRLWPELPPLALVSGLISVQVVNLLTPLLLEG
ncbi:MAG: ATP synthase subunit I [Halofilum sp. (in: g-proteobacteria)]